MARMYEKPQSAWATCLYQERVARLQQIPHACRNSNKDIKKGGFNRPFLIHQNKTAYSFIVRRAPNRPAKPTINNKAVAGRGIC